MLPKTGDVMDLANLDQTQLDQIAEEFSQAIRSGRRPSVDAYVAKYGDRSGKLRSLLSSIAMIEGLKQQAADLPPPAGIHSAKIEQLDDYKIVREIGRGGMGVVLEAIHQSLGRRVAIKVLASNLLGDTKHLARFRREARAAARLRHTNIVPVFGVGQSNDHHYYVMDYIDGMSLRQWLGQSVEEPGNDRPTLSQSLADTDARFETQSGQGPTDSGDCASSDAKQPDIPQRIDSREYFLWAARLMMTVCDALQYAHDQGVLHRDIKPANLLIDRRGEVWIADFGLAKLAEQQAMTMTGDILGTPQYMPPESFEGTYDVKSEVYAAGLTLYELLTGRPAVSGKGHADVIRKASAGVSTSPRKFNASVPRDLETIVLKSLALDPRCRYVTAGQLRDDLRRFLTDRPISARPTGTLGRVLRWSRREPTVAVLTFATFCLLLALATVSAVGYFETKSALAVARSATLAAENSLEQRTTALEVADQQRRRAEKNLHVALTALDKVVNNITDRGIEPDAEFLGDFADTTSANVTPEDAELLQSLLGFFDDLAANNSEDLLEESAVAARRAGEIYFRLGQLREADRALSEALDRYGRLKQQETDNLAFVIAQAAIMNELAVIASLRGYLGRANQLFHETTELLENSETAIRCPAGQFEYARAHRLFSSLGARSGLDRSVTRPGQRGSRARGPMIRMLQTRTDEELRAVDQAIETLEALIEQSPEEVRYRAELARAYRDKAKVASRAKRKGESETMLRESIEMFEQLLSENRDSEAIRYELAMTFSSSPALGFHQIRRSIRANELATTLLSKSPDLPRYQALRAHTLQTLATQQMRLGRLDSAETSLVQAVRVYDALVSGSPERSLYETQRSQTLESIADVKLRQGDSDAAIDLLEQAIGRLQPQLRRPDASPVTRIQLQRLKQKLTRIRGNS